eukprot:6611030-Prymnesium_polylepis.1
MQQPWTEPHDRGEPSADCPPLAQMLEHANVAESASPAPGPTSLPLTSSAVKARHVLHAVAEFSMILAD